MKQMLPEFEAVFEKSDSKRPKLDQSEKSSVFS
jgi:hypothetical protein